jgi:hypothetical protein
MLNHPEVAARARGEVGLEVVVQDQMLVVVIDQMREHEHDVTAVSRCHADLAVRTRRVGASVGARAD